MTIEGIVAMGVFFVLMTLVVQLGFLVIARSSVAASLDAAVRRGASPGIDTQIQEGRLHTEIEAIAPGLEVLAVGVTVESGRVSASVTVEWVPPGPDLVPVRFTLQRTHAMVVPP